MKHYILPLRDMVVHPDMTLPLYLDNPTSIAVMETAGAKTHEIILTPQRVSNYPAYPDELFDTGTRADILQLLRLPDGSIHAMVKTTEVVQLSNIIVGADGAFVADAAALPPIIDDSADERVQILRDRVAEHLGRASRNRRLDQNKLRNIAGSYPLSAFVDTVVQTIDLSPDTAIKILQMRTYREKLESLLEQVLMLAEVAKIDENISRRVNQQMAAGQKEAVLQEKLRAIQREMGEDEDTDSVSLKRRIDEAKMPKDATDKALSELKRLKMVPPMSAEGSVARTYLDELTSMPWSKSDKSEIDLRAARAELDRDHAGMNDVKERILEHLAVMKKTGGTRGTILCLVGAPGVGKTSIAQSVARALARKYHRISLGGVSDEAHFRGHRKTYIGSQPGRIMDALKRAGVNNPVIVLDEIDKLGRDYRGDPEAALLEILDPEQNKAFRDHYLEVDFDLSHVLFIATANTINISAALRDRMEIIEIPSYSEEEKLIIARDHLLARAAADTGWAVKNITIGDDALRHIIHDYTAEAGVRDLQRKLTAMLRKALLRHDGMDIATEFTIPLIDELLAATKTYGINKKIGFAAARV